MSKEKTISNLRVTLIFITTVVLILILFLTAMNIGGLKTSPAKLFGGLFIRYDKDAAVIFELRFPRIVVALLGGALMAVAGVLMQAVMKNPLADPGIIGIGSGAAFFAILVTALFPSLAVFMPVFSFLGGLLAFAIVYTLAWKGGEISAIRLILVGIAVNAVFTGLYQAFDQMTGGRNVNAARVISANISLKTWNDVKILAVYALIGLLLCILAAKKCNLLSLSDQTLHSLGVRVGRTKITVSVISVLLASAFTAVVGTVGFLGLIVPHIARLLVGSDHKRLIPYSVLLGAFIFLLADTVGRTIAYPYEISASVIMAVVGGPAFIILLKRSRRIYG
ncbi:MAG: iron ABC transporter permease [Oscillospiraceae bacterium]|jgi:iron complex transport system permease protein|nr:iron ABC transporter permease [Oscillospiraceae bacterium]